MISFNQLADTAETVVRAFSMPGGGSSFWRGMGRPYPSTALGRQNLAKWYLASKGPAPRPLAVKAGKIVGGRYSGLRDSPFWQSRAAGEIRRRGLGPAGLLAGRPVEGWSIAREQMRGGPVKFALGAGLLDLGISTFIAPRGKKLSYAAGSVAGTTGGMIGAGVGAFLGGGVGALVGGVAGDWLARTPVMGGLQKLVEFGRQQRHFQVGDFRDSQVAYTMRQRAAQELGRSLVNARQYLGKEALLMHQ